jgi:hypothetical protein
MIKVRPFHWGLIIFAASLVLIYIMFIKCGPTYYSARFNEGKFKTLRPGMPVAELEAIIGPPLEKVPQRDGLVLWAYSKRDDVTCSFWRRWVFVKDEKIESIDCDYWQE